MQTVNLHQCYGLPISYDSIATKDDRLFKRVCFAYIPKWRRPELVLECREKFAEAYHREPCDIKKPNAARRAANYLMLKEAVEYGMTNWREWQTRRQPESPVISGYASSPYMKPKQHNYTGPSILELADQQRKEQRRA